MKSYDVVIVGAGPVGLTLACALAQTDWSVCVLDAGDEPQVQEDRWRRVNAYNRGTEEFLKSLGVWAHIPSQLSAPFSSVWVGHTTKGHVQWSADEVSEPYLGHFISNDQVKAALRLVLAKTNVQLVWKQAIERLVFKEESVEVHTATDRLSARLVVGADGARSSVRRLSGIEGAQIDYDQRCIVGTIKIQGHHHQQAWQRFLSTGPLGLLPLVGPYYSLAWSVDTSVFQELMALPESTFLERLMACDLPQSVESVLSCEDRQSYPLYGFHANRYFAHRVALVGDAAHVVHPLAGLGANMGYKDAQVLADLLKMRSGCLEDPHRILQSYERKRRMENELLLRA